MCLVYDLVVTHVTNLILAYLFLISPFCSASFMSKYFVVDDKAYKFQIWDTAGQEKYHSLAPMYYRGAAAAIIVYDITRAETFTTVKKWVKELKAVVPDSVVIAICGNKDDLATSRVSKGVHGQKYTSFMTGCARRLSMQQRVDCFLIALALFLWKHLPSGAKTFWSCMRPLLEGCRCKKRQTQIMQKCAVQGPPGRKIYD
jgi:hypothetical protein